MDRATGLKELTVTLNFSPERLEIVIAQLREIQEAGVGSGKFLTLDANCTSDNEDSDFTPIRGKVVVQMLPDN